MENGCTLTVVSMHGDQEELLLDGDLTMKGDGCGQMKDGIGLQMNRGHGRHIIMAAGIMMTTMGGFGFRVMIGLQRGLNGDMAVDALGGLHSAVMRCSA